MLLVDHVLPRVPYRHVTFTFPGPLAVRLGYDRKLLAKVLLALGKRFDQGLRARLKHHYTLKSVSHLHPGSFSVVQRFRFDLGLYTHVHALVMDGAYLCDHNHPCAGLHPFYAAPSWSPRDLAQVVRRVDKDIAALLDTADDDEVEHDGIRACLTLGVRPSTEPKLTDSNNTGLMAAGDYVALHVANAFDGRDRKRLQRQVKYMLRPPVALDAVTSTDHGNLRITFKRPTAHGRCFTELTPRQLLPRLAALVAPPRVNQVRYRGVLSARHHLRPSIIEQDPNADIFPAQLALFKRKGPDEVVAHVPATPPTPRRIAWARLLARVFSVDVSRCPLCAGPMKVIDAVVEPSRIAMLLATPPVAIVGGGREHDGRRPPDANANAAQCSGLHHSPAQLGSRTSRGPPLLGQLHLFS